MDARMEIKFDVFVKVMVLASAPYRGGAENKI